MPILLQNRPWLVKLGSNFSCTCSDSIRRVSHNGVIQWLCNCRGRCRALCLLQSLVMTKMPRIQRIVASNYLRSWQIVVLKVFPNGLVPSLSSQYTNVNIRPNNIGSAQGTCQQYTSCSNKWIECNRPCSYLRETGHNKGQLGIHTGRSKVGSVFECIAFEPTVFLSCSPQDSSKVKSNRICTVSFLLSFFRRTIVGIVVIVVVFIVSGR
mmetsp:Transcript_27277/g.51153  ORF Transcript_27277/g.51153 Transcript_27277/m.51153 type:complete len:210 (-) Transcript_27277:364-993(-)